MSKHTPGPWEVVDLPHGIVVRTESPKKTRFGASRYAAIGGFDRAEPDQFAEAMANARLIASAPDMLEALETIVATERDRHGYHPAWTDQARAAIAKARGEA
jgi:hypothetical protein